MSSSYQSLNDPLLIIDHYLEQFFQQFNQIVQFIIDNLLNLSDRENYLALLTDAYNQAKNNVKSMQKRYVNLCQDHSSFSSSGLKNVLGSIEVQRMSMYHVQRRINDMVTAATIPEHEQIDIFVKFNAHLHIYTKKLDNRLVRLRDIIEGKIKLPN